MKVPPSVSHAKDVVELAEMHKINQKDFLDTWLQTASNKAMGRGEGKPKQKIKISEKTFRGKVSHKQASDVEEALKGASLDERHTMFAAAELAIDEVQKGNHKGVNLTRLVARSIEKAAEDSKVKHSKIKALVTATLVAGGAKMTGDAVHLIGKLGEESEGSKAKTALCVVRSGYASTLVVQAASDIHDAVKTCPHSTHDHEGVFFNNTRGQICSVNVGTAVMDLTSLAAILALLSEDCSASLVPSVDRYCAAAITGFITAFAQFAGAGVLFAALCGPNHPKPPPGLTPSNLGSTEQNVYAPESNYPYLDFEGFQQRHTYTHNRRLDEEGEEAKAESGPEPAKNIAESEAEELPKKASEEFSKSEPAPARELLYGGGKGSTATQCYADVTNAIWFLAQAGLAISSASGHTSILGGCPPTNLFGTSKPHDKIYHWSEVYCAVDVSGVFTYMFAVASFIQFAVANCGDVLNLPAICGAATTGVLAATSSTVQSAYGLHIACDKTQLYDPLTHKLVDFGRDLDYSLPGQPISRLIGRRLSEWEENDPMSITNLKKRFSSPEEVWKSIGIDINNVDKSLRQELKDHRPENPLSKEELAELVREAQDGLEDTIGLNDQTECMPDGI